MYRPKLEQIEYSDGQVQRVGWVLEDEAGRLYERLEHPGAAVTGFTREEMQALADELNAAG